MSKLADVSLGQADHPGIHNAERALLNARRTALPGDNLQSMVDQLESEGGGTLHFAGSHTIAEPLLLPRETPVHLCGIGPTSALRGAANFPEGRALIETAAGGRAVNQCLCNLSLYLPDVAGVKAFHHAVSDKSTLEAMSVERLQLTMQDVTIYVDNAFHEVAVHLEGGVHDSTFERVFMQPKLAADGYNTLLFQVGMELPDDWIAAFIGSDVPGLFSSVIRNCESNLTRGGKSGLFAGRAVHSKIEFCFCDGGSGTPCFDFYDSASITLSHTATEGRNEQPQYRFTRCSFVDGQQVGIGTPDDYYETGLGNGIELIDCHDCRFDGRWNASGKPSFSGKGVKVVKVDSDSARNTFTRWGIKSGGTPADEFTIAGTDNRVEYIDFGQSPVVSGVLTSD